MILINFAALLLLVLPLWILSRRRAYIVQRRRVIWDREILVNVVFLYCLAVANVTLVPIGIGFGSMSGNLSLVPFGETHWLLLNPRIAVINLAGNVALLFPLGLFLPLLSPKFQRFGVTVLAGMIVSVGIEVLQFSGIAGGGWRSADIDDVILNTVGTAVGYAVYAAVRPLWTRWLGRRS